MKSNNKTIVKNIIIILMLISIIGILNYASFKYNNDNIVSYKNQEINKKISIIFRKQKNNGKVNVTSRSLITRGNKQDLIERMEQEEEKQQIVYTKLEDIKISKNMDLTIRTGISKEDFKLLMSKVKQDTSKFFYDNSDMIYDLCQEYEINEIFFCGLISAESGWNIASNHRRTYNYISLMSRGKLIQYNSLEEGLTVAAQKLHNNYLTEGGRFYHGKTLAGVKVKFCPASSTWVDLVYGRMNQIMRNI